MLKGIVFALLACFIWGLIFVVPQLMEGFSSMEVAMGRYFFYGLFSSLILCKAFFQTSFRYPFAIWRKALLFSFFTSFGYYPFVVLSLRYANPAVCTLVLGISPITIAFYGNWKQNEGNFRGLIFPSIMIVLGLIIINAPQIIHHDFPTTFLVGLLCGLFALSTWTWYAVTNAQLLKNHPELKSSHWSTLIGVTTLFWVLTFGVVFGFVFNEHWEFEKYTTLNSTLIAFVLGSAVLGCLCSWVGAYLWNKACFFLPMSLAGQLLIFETIFGLLFVYVYEQAVPPLLEFVGIIVLLTAVLYGIRKSFQLQPAVSHS